MNEKLLRFDSDAAECHGKPSKAVAEVRIIKHVYLFFFFFRFLGRFLDLHQH